MSAPALAGGPSLLIRGTRYPILLPTARDPRLHLAAVIITLQVLGQTAFGFNLSIAQILVALGTAGLLEVGIAFFRQRVIMWPASALLTGNGVAFILRVPGTPHGEWWSFHGAWIFASVAAVSLLSKHVIRLKGRHIFNPSNFGLVLCFLVLGKARAEPLDFWWGPMSIWLALAVGLIVAGGFSILSRLRLVVVAVGFWLTFAAGIGVLAASGHSMTARWHVGPISGWAFWWLLVTSPEILIFLFFMITDPVTIPKGRVARLVYAVGVGLLATLLIAPQTTEYATKVAVLGALALVCGARPLLERLFPAPGTYEDSLRAWTGRLVQQRRLSTGAFALVAAASFCGLVVLAGIPARPDAAAADSLSSDEALPEITVAATTGVSSKIDSATARQIARDIVLDLDAESDALRLRDPERAAVGASGPWLVDLRRQLASATDQPIAVPSYRIHRVRLTLTLRSGQEAPRILAAVEGIRQLTLYRGSKPMAEPKKREPVPFRRSCELAFEQGHYVIIGSGAHDSSTPAEPPPPSVTRVRATGPLGAVRLQNVARQVGLDFRQGAFRFGASNDLTAMMGGGLCWLDYDDDGWVDLFVVNSYADSDRARWESHGGLPRSALFHNVGGTFVNVSRASGADLAVQGEGCVAADFNGDGHTDLYVTTSSYDKLLWNNGDGTFTEGAEDAGIKSFGWHAGAAVADVNGDGRPDLFVAGYTDLNSPVLTSIAGFPSNFEGVRDLLYLNEGPDGDGHSTFREVGVQAGLEAARFRHGLGALFTDYNADGRPDLYVANDEDPNQLYENVPWPGGVLADPAGLGFRFDERGAAEGVADPYAGMGIASGDYDGDGRSDLFVTNSRREPHAAFRHRPSTDGPAFGDARPTFRKAFNVSSTGWGASWVDLSLDGTPDLVLANGSIPITNVAKDAGQVQVIQNRSKGTQTASFANVGVAGLRGIPRVNGRGVAAADFDNNGTVDIAIGSIGGRLVLLRNSGTTGHWLEVKLTTFAPGTVVTAVLPSGRKLVSEVHAGSSYLSSEDPRVHFGLGDARTVRTLAIRFPNGAERKLSGVAADRIVDVQTLSAPEIRSVASPTSYTRASCVHDAHDNRSVARVWDEAALAASRADDAPTTEARNLFHLSAAMWDAWAAYDPSARGYFLTEKSTADDVSAARRAAISYAAYRLLLWRASYGTNVQQAFERLTDTMRSLCYRTDFVSAEGDSPAALGNRIAAAAIAYGKSDGSLESQHYIDPSYVPANAPLVLARPGTTPHDRTLWQPLAFRQITVQGGLPIPAQVQTFLGSQWGHVRGFALQSSRKGLPADPGPPPVGDPSSSAYKKNALSVIRLSARARSSTIEHWTTSATALARWNAVANAVSDSTRVEPGIGRGAARRLAWDVKMYFALNGALHDAAVVTWGIKRDYQSVRPISMIRSLAFQGQSSDPQAPSYNPDGLPLVPGLVELITDASSANDQRHAALSEHVGDIAVRTAHGWVLGTKWTSPVRTPPFPGWVSDESVFDRAAAEILVAQSGSGLLPSGSALSRWVSYRRVADAAGRSQVSAGTQIPADDFTGRRIGSQVGKQAFVLAERYFAGTATR